MFKKCLIVVVDVLWCCVQLAWISKMPPRAAPLTETEKIIKAMKDELAKFKGEFKDMKDLLSDKDERIATLEATVKALL